MTNDSPACRPNTVYKQVDDENLRDRQEKFMKVVGMSPPSNTLMINQSHPIALGFAYSALLHAFYASGVSTCYAWAQSMNMLLNEQGSPGPSSPIYPRPIYYCGTTV